MAYPSTWPEAWWADRIDHDDESDGSHDEHVIDRARTIEDSPASIDLRASLQDDDDRNVNHRFDALSDDGAETWPKNIQHACDPRAAIDLPAAGETLKTNE